MAPGKYYTLVPHCASSKQFADAAPLPPPLRTQPSLQCSNDLATTSETLFPLRYADAVYAITTSLMNSDKAGTHDEHTGTEGIDGQGTPQEAEQKGPIPGNTEMMLVQCASK